MIEEDALVAIIEGFLDDLEDVAGVEPVEAVQVHYHSPADEVLNFAFFRPQNRSINIASELIERAADEGGRWKDIARQAAYHEWGHALTKLIAANVGEERNISIEGSFQDALEGGTIDEAVVEHEDVERARLVEAVRNLHDAGYFEYDELEVPEGNRINSAEDFVAVIEDIGIVEGENKVNDPLGHSLGDSIGKNLAGVTRRDLHSGIIDLANDLGVVSQTGLNERDEQQMRLLEKAADVPTATEVRMSHPETDSEGDEVIIENGITLPNPPRYEIEHKMHGQRIFEGSVMTIPNKAQMEGGTFLSTVLAVEPESGARVESGTTTVEWVQE